MNTSPAQGLQNGYKDGSHNSLPLRDEGPLYLHPVLLEEMTYSRFSTGGRYQKMGPELGTSSKVPALGEQIWY